MLHRKKIGEVLCDSGKITRDQLVRALVMQEEKVGRLGDILVSMGACSEEDVLSALAQQLHMPFLEVIDVENIDPQIVMPLTSTYAKQHLLK